MQVINFWTGILTPKPIHLLQHSKEEAHVGFSYIMKWHTHCSTDITAQLPVKLDFRHQAPASSSHKSSSASGRAVFWATSKLCSYFTAKAGSLTISGLVTQKQAGYKLQIRVSSELSRESEGGIFKALVTFGRKVIVLKILCVEDNRFYFAFTFLSLCLLCCHTT